MTIQLSLPTPFGDIAELTENFAQRVDDQRLMLPSGESLPEGEWCQFSVLLADGSAALAGVGRIAGAYDNGEEHPPEYRFDIVLDSLQLEGMHEVMFERLMVARETQMKGEPVTGEVNVEALEQHAAAPELEEYDEAVDGTKEVDLAEVREVPAAKAAAAPKAPKAAAYPTTPRQPGTLPSPHTFNGHPLTRPSVGTTWSPESIERPLPAQSSGLFDYQGGVPSPKSPPRPDIDPSARVRPAPRPGAPWPRRGTEAQAEAEPAFEEVGVEDGALTTEGETAQHEAPPGEPEHEEW
jgi:hypothetical protein